MMLNIIRQGAVQNRLLRSMTAGDFDSLAGDLHPINLPFGSIVEIPGEPIDFLVFIERGIASRLILGSGDTIIESSHVGPEGMTGKPVIMGACLATNRIQMQVAGKGLTIQTRLFREAMDESKAFRLLMTRYALTCSLQAEHTLLAATTYSISQRLSRWLLMYHDRIDGDDFPVTHELLAMMLNVRRAGVTGAIHVLEGEQAVYSTRGSIRVVNRDILIEQAGGSYGIPEAIYESLIPPVPADGRILEPS